MTAASDAYARLAAEHEALMQFLYLAPVGLVQTAADGEILMINPVSAQLLMPLQRDGNLVNLFDALAGVAPELRHLCAMFARPTGMVCDGMHIQLGGRGPQVLSLTLLKLDEARLMAVLSDVTEQVRRDRQLRQNEAWLGALLTSITDYALVGLDGAGRVSAWNETIARITGHGEGPRVRADGSEFLASAMISPLPDRDPHLAEPGDPAYCLVLRDVSDKREAIDARRKSLFSDHLTGVANRRAFFEAAELELNRNRRAPRPTALVLLDADHFKRINDRHGHAGGDAVLRHLGQLLSATFRQVDVVARVGGEEFAVLLPSSGLDAAVAVAERLRGLVAGRPVAYDGALIACTISAGVAVCDGEALGLDGLMKRADRALYAAKAAGRDRVERWRPALDDEVKR